MRGSPAPTSEARDQSLMREALSYAREAARRGEVPVGALVLIENRVMSGGLNHPIGSCDPTAHAEIVAIREAAKRAANYRLSGAELFVTLEPCLMCFGAAIHARIARVVYGASDPRVGAASRIAALQSIPGVLNHRLEIVASVEGASCSALLRGFFAEKRRSRAVRDRSSATAHLRDKATISRGQPGHDPATDTAFGRLEPLVGCTSSGEAVNCGEVPKWS